MSSWTGVFFSDAFTYVVSFSQMLLCTWLPPSSAVAFLDLDLGDLATGRGHKKEGPMNAMTCTIGHPEAAPRHAGETPRKKLFQRASDKIMAADAAPHF